jgi:hypothetical protein
MRFYSMITPGRCGDASVDDLKGMGVRSMNVTFEIDADDTEQAMIITHRVTAKAGIGIADVSITPIEPPAGPW